MPGRPEQRGRFPTGRERRQGRLPRRRNSRRGKGQQEVESASSARATIDFVFRPSAVINKRLVIWSSSMVLFYGFVIWPCALIVPNGAFLSSCMVYFYVFAQHYYRTIAKEGGEHFVGARV